MPHTSSHIAVPAVSHVVTPDPVASVALTATAVAGVVAANRARRRLRPLSADAQARVDAGGSSLDERRREFFTEPMRGW